MSIDKEIQLILSLLKDYGVFSFVDSFKSEFYIQASKKLVNLIKLTKDSNNNLIDKEDESIARTIMGNSLNNKVSDKIKIGKNNSEYTQLSGENFNSVLGSNKVTVNNKLKSIYSLDEIKNILINFQECSLSKTATNVVFGVGNPKADLLMIGEAPGAEEDLQGKPFVGKSGQLLTKALSTIDVCRDNIFITNTIFWRPPGNRTPTPSEVNLCKPFIQKIISVIKPKMILIVGKVAATTLLEEDTQISKLRGKWLIKSWGYENEIVENIKVRIIYHPAYLLRNPKQKKVFWFDLIEISTKIIDLRLTV